MIISRIEEQVTDFNKALRKMLEYDYEFEFDPPSFPDEEAEWELQQSLIRAEEERLQREHEEELERI